MNGTSNIHLTKMKSILITEETQSKKKIREKIVLFNISDIWMDWSIQTSNV